MDGDIRPVFAKDGLTEGLAFNEGDSLVAPDEMFSCVGEATNAAEGV
jgi:hypothetical protein